LSWWILKAVDRINVTWAGKAEGCQVKEPPASLNERYDLTESNVRRKGSSSRDKDKFGTLE